MTKTVTRYAMIVDSIGEIEPVPSETGEWVRYADIEPLLQDSERGYSDGRRHACASILRHLLTEMRVDQSRPEIQDLFK